MTREELESRNEFGIKANETAVMYASEEENLTDRKQFVENLGWLLGQTREGVAGCFLDDDWFVHVVFRNGGELKVNVRYDSYAAIVRDVAEALK